MYGLAFTQSLTLVTESCTGNCCNSGIQWHKRCFVSIIQPYGVNISGPLTYNVATSMCDAKGGYPANIYDRQHFEVSMVYLRTKIPDDEFSMIVWLGMYFDPVVRIYIIIEACYMLYSFSRIKYILHSWQLCLTGNNAFIF